MLPSYKGYNFRELVGEQGVSASIHSWQDDGNQAAMHYNIDWADYTNSAFSQIIGYSKAGSINTAGVRVLNRVLPLNHPFFAWMWATRIQQVQPIGPAGMETAGADPFCEFELARCTIGFQSLPYTVLSDADLLAISTPAGVPDESLRYVEKLTVSQSETIEVQVGAMSYAEMPAALATPWTVVPARKYQTVDKDVLSWTWHRVAHKYLMTTGTDIPGNLKAARNTVNASTNIGDGSWNGYPPGTLLFKNYKLAPVDARPPPARSACPSTARRVSGRWSCSSSTSTRCPTRRWSTRTAATTSYRPRSCPPPTGTTRPPTRSTGPAAASPCTRVRTSGKSFKARNEPAAPTALPSGMRLSLAYTPSAAQTRRSQPNRRRK